MHQLELGGVGWDHDGWMEVFYPEGLPPDWRLTYYSNEFPCVLVPRDQWAGADASSLEQWVEDVHEGFSFWLELEASAIESEAAWLRERGSALGRLGRYWAGTLLRLDLDVDRLAHTLGADLADWLGHRSLVVDPGASASAPLLEWVGKRGLDVCWRRGLEPAPRGCRVGLLAAGEIAAGDRRALSAWLQEFLGQAPEDQPLVVFMEGQPPSAQLLQDASVIAGLLGV